MFGDKLKNFVTNATKNYINDITQNLNNSEVSYNDFDSSESETFTKINIFGASVDFKTFKNTNVYNTEDSFGAAEIDTVLVYSPGGKEIENYSDTKNMIVFQTSEIDPTNQDSVKNQLNRWHGITNSTITQLDGNPFMYKVVGENESIYYENHYMEYQSSELGKIKYQIYLQITKSTLGTSEINKLKAEYQTIIKTLKLEVR